MAKPWRRRVEGSGFVPSSEIAAALLESLGMSRGMLAERVRLGQLWANWSMVMGPELAPLARPLGRRHNILVVGAEDALLAQELHFQTDEMLERVNAFMESPVFAGVKVEVLMGRRGLDMPLHPAGRESRMPDWRIPAPPRRLRPCATGCYLADMNPASPVARAYARFAGMRGAMP